jgi:hypothetical protein
LPQKLAHTRCSFGPGESVSADEEPSLHQVVMVTSRLACAIFQGLRVPFATNNPARHSELIKILPVEISKTSSIEV